MRIHILFIVSGLICAGTAYARQLTPQEALDRASLSQNPVVYNPLAAGSVADAPKLVYTAQEHGLNTVYVFNRGDSGGFLMVAADDATGGTALLGYSDSGTFHAGDIPENISWWISQYSAEIAYAATAAPVYDVTVNTARESRQEIEPIVKTRWNQDAPYNDLCPTVNGTRCPTGCVATAMAQVMNVFEWPVKGIGSMTYKPVDVDTQLSVDFGATTYEWDKMLDRYDASSPAESNSAVATLMYSCGVSIRMDYTPNSSGGNYSNASVALIENFDYDKSLRCLSRDYYSLETWTGMIYDELQQGRPVLYGGTNSSSGHAFVCDGYREGDYFHINWGWGGISDGYFLITALNPDIQGIGGSSSGYNIGQTMVVGIQRPQADAEYYPVIQFVSDFSVGATSYPREAGETVTFRDRRGIFNNSAGEVTVTMGVKITDSAGNVSYLPSAEPMSLISGQAFVSYTVPAESFPQSGTYTVSPALRTQSGEWLDDGFVSMEHARTLNLNISDGKLVFSPEAEAYVVVNDFTLDTPLFSGESFAVSAVLTAREQEYYDDIVPILIKDYIEVAQGIPVAVDIEPNQSQNVQWVGTFNREFSPGNYKIYLVDSHGKTISTGIDVVVEATPTEKPEVTMTMAITGAGGKGESADDPAMVSLADFNVELKFVCTAGYYADNIFGKIYYNTTGGLKDIGGTYIGIKKGQSVTVNISADLSDLDPDHTYLFYPWANGVKQLGEPLYFRASTSGMEFVDIPERFTVTADGASSVAEVRASSPMVRVDLYSMSGALSKTVAVNGDTALSIDLGGLDKGIYFVRAMFDDSTMAVERIVRN